jgi:hypothetical protein
MKSFTLATILAQAAIASADVPGPRFHHGGWMGGPNIDSWGGGPRCAVGTQSSAEYMGNVLGLSWTADIPKGSCYSSYWQSVTPTPYAYCGAAAAGVDGCISSACTSATSDLSVFNSVSASVCSVLTACGTIGTYTYTYTTPVGGGTSRPPRFGQTTPTWATGAVTVTGCPWNGGDVGWGWWGPGIGTITGAVPVATEATTVYGGQTTVVGGVTSVVGGVTTIVGGFTTVVNGGPTVIGGLTTVLGGVTSVVGGITSVVGGLTAVVTPTSTWGEFGPGWSYTTWTTPVMSTITVGTSLTTATGEATIAEAIGGASTIMTTLGAGITFPTSVPAAAAAPIAGGNLAVKAVGAALGAMFLGVGII